MLQCYHRKMKEIDITSETIWVNKADLAELSLLETTLPILGEGEVRLRVESFSVTANNVTYAVSADMFGYWNFFPADDGFGIVPMWGHAIVVQSQSPDIAIGERVYGYLPMGTHLDVLPGKISANGFTDMSAHRQPMSPVYNQYSRLASDPEHDGAKEAERMLFGPLFKTGFLIEAMFRREGWFGATNLIMTSASSKTAMGLASVAKELSPAITRIGLTSNGNMDFVRSTGLYDVVMSYDDVASLPQVASVSVDFAGNSALLRGIHTTLGDHLKYSSLVGATHVDARGLGGGGSSGGPKPVLFFAPDHAVALIKELGPKGFGEAVAASWKTFLSSADGKVTFDERQGIQTAVPAFLDIMQGRADPSIGIIIRP
jgi:Protein of unknown function (DUF2855)